ncbi:hypothetical protein GIB67_015084 [Kingdonia uniflora]|uniref:Uncharacterized protein n=1 Tax=Kingdonia uniflora TaxID=39325 RepID=A0A7J7LJ90_9MAGN|nr:hypothetical protein GIB67_015084 [Kingdonia uniflora]
METEGQCLSLMRELNSISKLFDGAPKKFASVIKSRRVALNSLIKYVKRGDDHRWVLDYKDVTDFESRSHLALLLLPEVREDYNENHEMLIDRLQIFPKSL